MTSGDGMDSGEDLGLAPTAVPAEEPAGEPATALRSIADRPPPDRLARAVARARISDKLFATRQEVKLGRYHLLEQIGAGGMGVVWGAFDPELDRRVAIKLVKAELTAARDRILTEGKALAKLAHPNVVTVHDVGVVDDQIYIVMEWVRGENLRAHCKQPRPVRELLALYRAAGEGLAAAHRAGLIHRDFKPDNAVIGDDGRVRVLDFGLARGEVRRGGGDGGGGGGERGASDSGALTRGAGTPRYMPPEQAAGEELTPAVDQYAFCVSLREALTGRDGGERPADVPRWLDEILARGTAREAAHRFPSMDALLAALARDPATVWRRRLLALGAAGAAGAAFVVGTLRAGGGGSAELERCAGGAAEIAAAWSPPVRERVAAHLRGLGPYGTQEASRVGDELTAYGARWAAAHREACLASERGELTAQLYERDLGCLARARAALETVVDVLAAVPADRIPGAVIAARELPDAARCLVDAKTSTVDPPPAAITGAVAAVANEVARARVLVVALDPRAVDASGDAVRRALDVGYVPLTAAARLVHGRALITGTDAAAAATELDRAVVAAFEAGDPQTAIEAFARELYAIAITERAKLPADVVERVGAVAFVEAIARQLGPRGGFARALLYNNLGIGRMAAGDREGGRRWFEQARAVREVSGASAVELAAILGNLAIATPDRAERDALFARKSAELERALGADHPMTLDARIQAAMFVENPRRAYELSRVPCERYRALHPHLGSKIAQCSGEVGWLAEELGDRAQARVSMAAVLSSDSAEPHERELAAAFLLILDGKDSDAVSRMVALAEQLRGQGNPWWIRFKAVNAWIAAATIQRRLGAAAAAVASLESALAILESLPPASWTPHTERRLARARALLARQLAAADPVRARSLARVAAAWYHSAGGADALAAELDALARGAP